MRLARFHGKIWIIDPALPITRGRIHLINPRDTSQGVNPIVENTYELQGEELERQVNAIEYFRNRSR